MKSGCQKYWTVPYALCGWWHGCLLLKEQQMALVIIVCSNCVMIFKFFFNFQIITRKITWVDPVIMILKVKCTLRRFGGVSIKSDFITSSVPPSNFDLFQFSSKKKYLNRFYYNYVKGKKHNFGKIWWICHKVWLHTLLNSSLKLWY